MRYYFSSSDREITFEMVKKNDGHELVNLETKEKLKAIVKKIGSQFFYSLDNKQWKPLRSIQKNSKLVAENEIFDLYKGFKPSSLFDDLSGGLVTQIPGKVIKINCQVGDQIKVGQTLLVLEAMKMENEIKAKVSGVVSNIYIKENQALEAGTLMLDLAE